ncbi:outer membrane receptor protein [Terriglobus roseus DSM 18391]|uniref:Outer membrane receptor protein n=1 Tax=Terriglobus roseus (strain DSM 18391 / NRRL B-41598 / KBS 63) TaxID=926566 RepID=I3ZBV3_TERRK|nr:TonB-dependent receptor [Terriglobus roseus]AFL86721.1 outer membrane receptor protein [Terriglobus roseus DSM 18391]
MPLDRRTALLPLLLSVAAPALAQTPTGSIRLQVKDPAGRALPSHGTLYGAGASRRVTTESDGSLTLSDLAYGRYTLVLSNNGFAAQTLHFDLRSSEPVQRNVVLTLGSTNTSVDVIASTPIGSLDVPLSDVPLPVQTVTSQTLEDTNAIDLTDTLKRRLNGVYVNENQNNPFQPDVNYRGYTASPLVGAPAGLSVYMDGVRQNQPFGDVVQWDLIPKVAIASTELIPGSNPVYGLNTLGGAIAVQTKDGISNSGFSISGYGGSFGRRAVDAQYGGSNNAGWNWFAAGTLFHEDGWRAQSPSSVKQSFAKLGYAHGETVLSLSGGYAINNLVGNGTQDFRAIARTVGLNHGYNSVYSIPDATYQHQPFLTLNATQGLTHNLSLNINAYLRYTRTNTSNGDINNDSFDQSLYTLSAGDRTALTRGGIPFPTTAITPANTPYPYLRCIAQALSGDEPAEKCTGVMTDSVNRQHAYGFSGALSWNTTRNKLSVGAGLDRGGLTFIQTSQWGYLNTDGITITRVPAFSDGSEIGDGGRPIDSRVNLHGVTNTPSIYVTDTLSLGKWVFNAGGRYNHTNINNTDRLPPSASHGSLTGVNIYHRFNPTAGFVYKPGSLLHAYFDYGESSRAPTSTELGCADPDFPCSLPNAMVSDPPLKQVVSRTYEFGFRGNPNGRYRYSAGYFHTVNNDDLLFVASQVTGFGYFQNFGKTRRQGVEASTAAHLRNVDAGVAYTFLEATYQSTQVVEANSNSTNSIALAGEKGVAEGGTITIQPGNKIPQVPQHMLKVYVDYHPLRKLGISADFNAIGSSFVKGNDNNLHQPDGQYYLGSGKSPGYGVVNLGSRYKFNPHFELFAEINNLLNRQYYTTGQLATTPYDNNGNFTARPFTAYASGDYPLRNTTYLSPGAPITVFGGMKVSFGSR